jgi:hypothetical protein
MGLDEKGKERLRSVQVENGKLNNINKVWTFTRHREAMHALKSGPYRNAWCDGVQGHEDSRSNDSISRYKSWSSLLRFSRHVLRSTKHGSTPHSKRSCTRSISPPYTAT